MTRLTEAMTADNDPVSFNNSQTLSYARTGIRALSALIFLSICALAIVSTPGYLLNVPLTLMVLVAIASLSVLGAMLWYRQPIFKLLVDACDSLAKIPVGWFWFSALSAGLLLRIFWFALFPFETSGGGDSPINWALAVRLVSDGVYFAETHWGDFRGLYPPGLPFLLAPFAALFGGHGLGVLAFQCCLFIWTALVIHAIVRRYGGEGPARLAMLITALAPQLFMMAPLALKEPLIVACIMTMLLGLLRSEECHGTKARAAWAAAAGICLGWGVLTQSSIALFIPGILLFGVFFLEKRQRFFRIFIVVAMAITVIAPWSIRQTLIFDSFTPLTTGGGWSFYTGNNAASWGYFTPPDQFFPDFHEIPERDISRVSFDRGLSFIEENPVKFVELAIRRVLMQSCCLDEPAYFSVDRDSPIRPIAQAISCLAWFLIVSIILLRSYHVIRAAQKDGLIALAFCIPSGSFLLHGLFEASSRHMAMHLGVFIVAAALVIAAPGPRNNVRSD